MRCWLSTIILTRSIGPSEDHCSPYASLQRQINEHLGMQAMKA